MFVAQILDEFFILVGIEKFSHPLPSLDAKFYIFGKEFEVRDALSLATMTIEQVVNKFPDNPDVPSVRLM